jgi:hypothetical protein
MSEDIVERLRFGVALDEQGDVSFCNQEAMFKAADEIERLRAENERLREAATALFDLIDEIDTISDLAKDDDRLYRRLVERTQRRRFEMRRRTVIR